MITILYCPVCRVITGIKAYPPAEHITTEGLIHDCSGLEIDEPEYTGETGFITADNSEINDLDEWLIYLTKYIP